MTPREPKPRAAPRSFVIGILGGIASGKSAAARLLVGPEGVVIDADRIAGEVLASPEVRAEIEQAFGPDVLQADGAVDRERLAARVFGSTADRARLESLTHPRIRARVRSALEAARAAGVARIALDVPLLLENEAGHRLVGECDALVFVDADAGLRDARAVASRGWASGEVARREAAQTPLAQKRARAQAVVRNDGTLLDLEREVARVRAELEPA